MTDVNQNLMGDATLDQAERWDPLRLLGEEVGRMFERLGGASWRTVRPFPTMNVYERGHRFLILAELPGVDPAAIEVSVAGDTLTIRGERRRDDRVPDDQYRRQERPFGQWERSVTLPESVLANEVSADIEHGVLRIELPKAVRPRPQQIPVTARSAKTTGTATRHRALEPPQSQTASQLPRPALPASDIEISSPPASDEGQS